MCLVQNNCCSDEVRLDRLIRVVYSKDFSWLILRPLETNFIMIEIFCEVVSTLPNTEKEAFQFNNCSSTFKMITVFQSGGL